MIRQLSTLALMGWLLQPAFAAQPPAHFRERPRVSQTAAGLEAWRKDPARSDEIKSILTDADRLLAEPVKVPVGEGQWYFFYLCPRDGVRLTADSPNHHHCERCGSIFEDERSCSAYRGIQWGEVDQAISKLALAYSLSTNDSYAAEARRLWLGIAVSYPALRRHDRWGDWGSNAPAGGRRYAQRLDEATSGIQLSKAYDLMANAPCMTDEDRNEIERNFFRVLARDLQTDSERAMWEIENPKPDHFFSSCFDGGCRVVDTIQNAGPSPHRSNHQSWQNACLATIGLMLADESLMTEAVYGASGLLWQLDHSVTGEGLWYELCMNYQFYAMSALIETVQAADRVGWSFRDNSRLRSLWEGPVRFSYPDGSFPVINDSDVDTIQAHAGVYQWAADYFGDSTLAALATPTDAIRASLGATMSTNMTGAGLVYLRNNDASNPICVVLDYGPHGGQHGHPDKLNMTVYACGREIVADTGRIGYRFREHQEWARTTAANNTVVINGKNQQPAEGRVLTFRAFENGGSVTAQCDSAYPGYMLTRRLILEGQSLSDEVTVSGGQPALMDLMTHVRGLILPDGEAATLTGAGYGELADVREGKTNSLCHLVLNGGAGDIIFENADVWFTGTATGTQLDESIPFILRRVEGTQAVFKTTYRFSAVPQ